MINCDSKGALKTINSFTPKHAIVNSIRDLIIENQKNGNDIRFIWIPSYIGIQGNEEVDLSAKEAIQTGEEHTDVLYKSEMEHFVRKIAESLEQIDWDIREGCNKLYETKPIFHTRKAQSPISRRLSVIVHRLKIGHTRLTHEYLLKSEDIPYYHYCRDT